MFKDDFIQQIKEEISNLRFENAYIRIIAEGKSLADEFWNTLSNTICYDKPMEVYCFLMYCISRNENAELHYYIFQLLIFIKPFIDDPYILAYWHMKRALELEPDNIKYMHWILKVFEPYPEQILLDNEIYEITARILMICPEDPLAIELKRKYDRFNNKQ